MDTYKLTHPWISFDFDAQSLPPSTWVQLGQIQAQCHQLAGAPLQPIAKKELSAVTLARHARGTTAIEGEALSQEEVLSIVNGEDNLPESKQQLKQEVVNIIALIKDVSDRMAPAACNENELPPLFSLEELKEFNQRLFTSLPLKDEHAPGDVRRRPILVGDYHAPPFHECWRLLDRLVDWINNFDPSPDAPFASGVLKAVIAHIYLSWILPFSDGNGRTARIMEFKLLLAAGAPPPVAHLLCDFYGSDRKTYLRKLDSTSTSGGNMNTFIQYAVQGLQEEVTEFQRTVRYRQLLTSWIRFIHAVFHGQTAPAALRRLNLMLALAPLRENPVRTADIKKLFPQVAQEYASVTSKALTRDINELCKMGLLVKDGRSVRCRVEQVRGLLS